MIDACLTRRAFALGMAATALAGCSRETGWLHFDAMLRIDTPRGVVSGQSRLRAKRRSASSLLPGDTGSTTFLGEAPFVDLGNGRLIVALLEAPYARQNLLTLLFDALRSGHSVPPLPGADNLWRDAIRLRPVVTLDRAEQPFYVTFGDKSAPTSVRKIDPFALASAFGAGYAFRDLTLSVTDSKEEAASRLLDVLPWLDRPLEARLDPVYRGDSNPPLARLLTRTNFIKGRV